MVATDTWAVEPIHRPAQKALDRSATTTSHESLSPLEVQAGPSCDREFYSRGLMASFVAQEKARKCCLGKDTSRRYFKAEET